MKSQKKKEERISDFKYELTDEEVELKTKYTKEVLSKKNRYKTVGSALVKKELVEKWNSEVNKLFRTKESIWYNGVILEAALECMKKLSSGTSLEEAYKIIDVQNLERPCIKLGMKLTGYQNYLVAELVGKYHKRGKEFCEYRSTFIKKPHYKKSDSVSLQLKMK